MTARRPRQSLYPGAGNNGKGAGRGNVSPRVAVDIRHGDRNAALSTRWSVAEEIPLVMFFNGERFGVMMVSPADLEEFVIGFSLNEAIITRRRDIGDIRFQDIGEGMVVNILVPEKRLEKAMARARRVVGGSSCGICGAQTLEAALPRLQVSGGLVPGDQAIRSALGTFSAARQDGSRSCHSVGMHRAALMDDRGQVMLARQDVGRHNALDKLRGAMAERNLCGRDGFLTLSSRFSVEMAQKAAAAGFSLVAICATPTRLALETARRAGIQIVSGDGEQLVFFTQDEGATEGG